jgi:hypothetical protein
MPDEFVLSYLAEGVPREHALERDRMLVGRARDCDLCFPYNTEISRLHATFIANDGEWSVEDVCSRSGTFLNGERVEGRRALADGDRLRIGRVELMFRRKQHDVGTVVLDAADVRAAALHGQSAGPAPEAAPAEEAAVAEPPEAAAAPPQEVAASHYGLVGVAEFEHDVEKIQAAATERIRQLRQSGESDERAIDAVSQALACLTNPERKQAYDRQLAEAKGLEFRIHDGRVVPVSPPEGAEVAVATVFVVVVIAVVFGVGAMFLDSLRGFVTNFLNEVQRALTG